MKQVAMALCAALLTCGAQGQLIYRCGPADGTEYSHTPCVGGKVLESSDPRSAAQRAEAVRVAAADKKRATELERERRAQEASTKAALATGFNGRPPPPDAAASAAERGKTKPRRSKAKAAKEADFVAVEPGSGKKRKGK